jgi:hypothetical protein
MGRLALYRWYGVGGRCGLPHGSRGCCSASDTQTAGGPAQAGLAAIWPTHTSVNVNFTRSAGYDINPAA